MLYKKSAVYLLVLMLPCLVSAETVWEPFPSGLTGGSYAGTPLIVSSEFGYMWGPLLFKGEVGLGGFKFDFGYGMRQQRDSEGALPYTRGFSAALSILDTWFLAPARESAAVGLELRGHHNLLAVKLGYYFATNPADANILYIAAGLAF